MGKEVFYSAKVVEPSECKLIRKPICTNDETMVSLLNQIIEEAVFHGGDSGGPYFCNDIDLDDAIKRFIHYIGADDLYNIEWGDQIPKIVLRGGGENAN